MHGFHSLQVVFREFVAELRVRNEESVMGISGWMLLRLEKRVKVPKGIFHVVVGRHFRKAHFQEDLSEFSSHFEQRMEESRGRWDS